ncbi:MAG: glycosyltransferase family 2 protein [Crenarchaeota archaeon]|nr:glycosyltransferase family 2 protein [Thermoproteota archaeon]
MNPKILAIIPTLDDDPSDTIRSLLHQTIKVSQIFVVVGSKRLYEKLVSTNENKDIVKIFYVKPDFRDPLGKRVAKALNYALSMVELNNYDYLLRVDADTVLPKRFIEENIKVNADYVGKSGYAMLLKMNCFLRVFKGRFIEVAFEDTHMGLKLLSQGYSVQSWALPPKLKRKSGAHHSWRYYFIRGMELYKLGYEPVHMVELIRHDIRNIFAILGYFAAIIKRARRYDIASWVFRAQLRRLLYGKGK